MKPMKNPLGVSSSKGYQETTRGREKILMTSVGIEPTTSGLDLALLCRLSYEVGQRKSGTIKVVNRGEDNIYIVSEFNRWFPCSLNYVLSSMRKGVCLRYWIQS